MLVDAAVRTVHLLFAAVWAGSVLYVTLAVVPLARDGGIDASPLESLSGSLTTVSRASAVVLLLTGGHMAARGYAVGGGTRPALFGSTSGRLVLAMVALWLALAALVEVAARRFEDGLHQRKVRSPARETLPLFRAASVVAIGLLVVAGLLTTGAAGRLV